MSILPPHTPAFDIEITQRRVLNAIANSTEFPTQRSNDQYAGQRCVAVETHELRKALATIEREVTADEYADQ